MRRIAPKSSVLPFQITEDGAVLTNQLWQTFVAASDSSTANVNPPASDNVTIETMIILNPRTVPQY